jgi:predicted MFS family arabinose efflux permease
LNKAAAMTSRTGQERMIVAGLFLVLFIGVADNQVISPLLPAIRTTVKRNSAEMGVLFTGYSLFAGFSVLFWGPLSDRFGRKNGLLGGLFFFSAGAAVCFVAHDFHTLLAGRIITGIGASLLSLNAISYTADYFPYASRGWAMGSVLSSYFAAMILGVPIGSWLGDHFGWNAVFGMACITAIFLLATTQLFLPRLKRNGVAHARGLTPGVFVAKYLNFLRTAKTAAALMSALFASAGTMGFLAFLGVWLHDAFGIQARQVGLVFLASGAAALVASPFAGALSDRIGKRVQFVLSNLILAALLLLLPLLQWGPWLFGVFCGISLAAAFRQGPMEALLTECVPADSRGSFIALKNSFSQLGIALVSFSSGILFLKGGYWPVCLLGAVCNILAATGIWFFLQDRKL